MKKVVLIILLITSFAWILEANNKEFESFDSCMAKKMELQPKEMTLIVKKECDQIMLRIDEQRRQEETIKDRNQRIAKENQRLKHKLSLKKIIYDISRRKMWKPFKYFNNWEYANSFCNIHPFHRVNVLRH